MLPTALPNIHAALVHFPVALVPVALLLEALSLAWRGSRPLDLAASLAWLLAAVASFVTFLAGRAAADGIADIPASVQPAIGAHADAALRVLGVAWLLALARLATWRADRSAASTWTGPARVLLAAAGVTLVGLVAIAADRGGALVYRHGLAVTLPEPQPVTEPVVAKLPAPGGPPKLTRQGDAMVWVPSSGDQLEQANTAAFLDAAPARSTTGALVAVDGRSQLLFPDTFGDAQLDAWLDVSGFSGSVWLLHHVGDDRAGAFEVSSAGPAALATVGAGSETLDSGFEPVSGSVALAVSAAGHHLKGMVDGKLVVHGHTDPLPGGRVGLLFNGQGLVLVKRVEVIPLGVEAH